MKVYLIASGVYALIIWFVYGNYIEILLNEKKFVTEEQRIVLSKLRLFSYKATGLKLVMLKKETWSIDEKLSKYMAAYIISVTNLIFTGIFLISR